MTVVTSLFLLEPRKERKEKKREGYRESRKNRPIWSLLSSGGRDGGDHGGRDGGASRSSVTAALVTWSSIAGVVGSSSSGLSSEHPMRDDRHANQQQHGSAEKLFAAHRLSQWRARRLIEIHRFV